MRGFVSSRIGQQAVRARLSNAASSILAVNESIKSAKSECLSSRIASNTIISKFLDRSPACTIYTILLIFQQCDKGFGVLYPLFFKQCPPQKK